MTLEDAFSLIDNLNLDAYEQVLDLWWEADAEMDEEEKEIMQESASDAQSKIFRQLYDDLKVPLKNDIRSCLSDPDFREQFRDYYGREEFDLDFGE